MSPAPDYLRPELDRAKSTLDARLTEACERHSAVESTGELIKLEEVLTDAAHAAKEAISIRRRLGVEREKESYPATSDESGSGERVREFVDAAGCAWHVWEVPAEQLSASSRPRAYTGEFENGWLAFEAATGGERRRLPNYPRDWRDLPASAIESLCRDARPATPRRQRAEAPRDDSSSEETDIR